MSGEGVSVKRKAAKWILWAVVYAVAFAVNLGVFAWGWSAKPVHMAVTTVYAMACVWFFLSGRNDRACMKAEMIAGLLTAAAGVLAVLVRAAGLSVLTIPAVLLAGAAVTPLYGLRGVIPDYDVVYCVVILLGAAWFSAALWFFRRAEGKGENACSLL